MLLSQIISGPLGPVANRLACERCRPGSCTANLRAKILDFRGFASSRILSSRGGILLSIGKFPESLSQRLRILAARILAGRLGALSGHRRHRRVEHAWASADMFVVLCLLFVLCLTTLCFVVFCVVCFWLFYV